MKTKRFLSILLSLVLVLGMFPGMNLTASAAGTTKTINPGTDNAKTGNGTMTITLIIKGDPAATDFDVTLPTSLAYDGKAKTATAAAKSAVTGMGTITVEYYKGGTKVDSTVDVGDYTFKLKVADDGTHYNAGTVENADWKFTITKGTPTVTKPTPKTLTYNGQEQELVNAGSTNDGTLLYAVTTENKAPTDASLYATSIPTATDVGTYYVWYKVVGDTNHNDIAPQCIPVTISQTESEKQTEKQTESEKQTEKQTESEKQTEKQDTTPSGGGGGSLPQTADPTPSPTPTPSETVEQPTTTGDPAITQDAFTGVSEVIETSTDGTASVTSVSGTVGKTLRITGTVNQGGTNYPVSSFATSAFSNADVKNIFIDLKTSGNTQTVTFQPRTFKGSEAKKLTLRLSSSGQVKFSSGAMSGSKIKKVVVSGLKKKEFKRVEKKLRKSGYKGKIVKK